MAKVFLISYDLNKGETSSEYQRLIKEIKSFGTWAKPLESTWFVVSDSTTSSIRDHLTQFIDSNDEILVMDVSDDDWACKGLNNDVVQWMKNHL